MKGDEDARDGLTFHLHLSLNRDGTGGGKGAAPAPGSVLPQTVRRQTTARGFIRKDDVTGAALATVAGLAP